MLIKRLSSTGYMNVEALFVGSGTWLLLLFSFTFRCLEEPENCFSEARLYPEFVSPIAKHSQIRPCYWLKWDVVAILTSAIRTSAILQLCTGRQLASIELEKTKSAQSC